MTPFLNARLNRDSIISSTSSSSKDSIDSQESSIVNKLRSKSNIIDNNIEKNKEEMLLNEQSKGKADYSREFLFFGPLVLCIILLISGIIIFIIVGQQNNVDEKKTNEKNPYNFSNPFNLIPDDNLTFVSCPFIKPSSSFQSAFALNELQCGLNRSSLIHLYYSNDSRPIHPGEKMIERDVIIVPEVQLNFYFLSKFHCNSFILLLIDPKLLPRMVEQVVLYWIRYFSSSLEEAYDICHYRYLHKAHVDDEQLIVLLYATNFSRMMIIGKTICHPQRTKGFQLIDYVELNKLKLIGATHFFIPYVKKESNED